MHVYVYAWLCIHVFKSLRVCVYEYVSVYILRECVFV